MPTKHVHLFHRKPKNARWDSGHAHQANRCCPWYIPGDIPFEKTPGGHLVDCSFFPAEVLMMNLRSIKRTGLAARVPANMTPRQCEVFAKELDHVVDDLQSHFAQENPKPKAFGPGWHVEWTTTETATFPMKNSKRKTLSRCSRTRYDSTVMRVKRQA